MASDFSGLVDAMRAAGLEPPESVVADGRLHRFSSNGKRGDAAGWYVAHCGDRPAAAFGDWRTGVRQTWTATRPPLPPAERAALRRRASAEREARFAKQQADWQAAAARAAALWARATKSNPQHPYLLSKQIAPYGGIRQIGGHLVIPLHDNRDQLWSLQSISPTGRKKFLPGGRVRGLYFRLPGLRHRIYLTEGYATGATIRRVTSCTVLCAFSAHNLIVVAEWAARRWPRANFLVAADNDQFTTGNPGVTAAHAAAARIGAEVVIPEFPVDALTARPTDFNDASRMEAAGWCARL